ncbi:hypothetical protein Tco_1258082 [Tanacetum coccineum]
MTPPPGFSTPPQIPNITISERPPAITTVFAATTPENTPLAYHASTSTNPNPTISLAFDYDEEREIEPRLEPLREATSTLWLRSPGIRKQQERVMGFENAPNEEGNRRRRNAEGIRSSKIEAREGFVHGLRKISLVEHLSTNLPSTFKGLMEKTYTWVEAREVATNGVSNGRRDDFERSKKSSWDNNRG